MKKTIIEKGVDTIPMTAEASTQQAMIIIRDKRKFEFVDGKRREKVVDRLLAPHDKAQQIAKQMIAGKEHKLAWQVVTIIK